MGVEKSTFEETMANRWQLEQSSKSVKKRRKMDLLTASVEACGRCLEVGCETGVVSFYLARKSRGTWVAAVMKPNWLEVAKDIVKTPLISLNPEVGLPFKTGSLDTVLISRPEHVHNDMRFISEAVRVLKEGGALHITTPHVGKNLFLNKLKDVLGLTADTYDHARPGYSAEQIRNLLEAVGLRVLRISSYSKLFTELIEIATNAAYFAFGSYPGPSRPWGSAGQTSYRPSTQKEFQSARSAYSLYKRAFPLLLAVSKMDAMLFFADGYVLYAKAVKPER